jgi:hypothetical protein
MSGAPMLRAAGLWRKTSAAGNEYFAGRLGGVKIVILSNRDRGEDETQPTHHLYFADRAPRQENAAPATPRRSYPRRAPYPNRPPVRPDSVGLPDIDDIGR